MGKPKKEAERAYQDDINVLNYSKINTYLRCPLQFYFRYVKGIKTPPQSGLTFGKSFHRAIAVNYKQKIKSRKDLKIGDVCDAFVTEFDGLKDETEWEKDEDPGKLKDIGIRCVNKYQFEIARAVQPAYVEQEFEVRFENMKRPFKGTLDLADIERIIRDSKTTKSKPRDGCIFTDFQTTGYALGYRTVTGKAEKGVALDFVVKYKAKEPEVITQRDTRTKADIDAFLSTVGKIDFAIEHELYYPNPHNFMCNEKGCGYYPMCKGGRKIII